MQNISAMKLREIKPHAFCCDCEREVIESKDEEIWTIQSNLIRCRKCSDYEGLY